MIDSTQRTPRTGKLARTAITGLTTARVGAAQLRRVLSNDDTPQATAEHEARIGKILFAAMSQMRGTALKAAQVLSLDATFLPAGVRTELARATHRVTPLNRALVGRLYMLPVTPLHKLIVPAMLARTWASEIRTSVPGLG